MSSEPSQHDTSQRLAELLVLSLIVRKVEGQLTHGQSQLIPQEHLRHIQLIHALAGQTSVDPTTQLAPKSPSQGHAGSVFLRASLRTADQHLQAQHTGHLVEAEAEVVEIERGRLQRVVEVFELLHLHYGLRLLAQQPAVGALEQGAMDDRQTSSAGGKVLSRLGHGPQILLEHRRVPSRQRQRPQIALALSQRLHHFLPQSLGLVVQHLHHPRLSPSLPPLQHLSQLLQTRCVSLLLVLFFGLLQLPPVPPDLLQLRLHLFHPLLPSRQHQHQQAWH